MSDSELVWLVVQMIVSAIGAVVIYLVWKRAERRDRGRR